MIKVFKQNRNIIGNLAIALLLLGGCVFMFTSGWNAPETVAASGCCGGGATATTLTDTTTGGCCGSANQVSDSDEDDYKCDCLDAGNTEADCGDCEEDENNDDSECNSAGNLGCGGSGSTDCNEEYCAEMTYCLPGKYCPNDSESDGNNCEGLDSAGNCLNE